MTMNPFKFVLSDEFYMRYDYSDMMLSILSFSERGAVCSLIQSERIINDYDWERDYDYLTTHKPIDGVFKKPSVSKDKISLELPIGKSEFIFEGKVLKKQKTDVSKWEQKFNQISKIVNSPDPDSAVVISDFEKLYEIIRGLKGKLGKDNLIIFTIKKSGKGRDQLSTFSINNTLLMEHGIESPFLVFDSEKTDEINVYLDYGIVCRVLKLIIDNNHYGTKGNIRIEFSEKNPVVFDWDASIVVAQKRLTPDEIKSIKTQNKDKMTAKKTTKKTPAAKKASSKKTAGTRTKGLHQTGTQTLAGKSMDAKIRAALPGKRTSATGKTYYEYRVNRTDMPTEREDFEKLFGKVKRAPAKKKTAAKKTPTKKTASGTSAKKKTSSGTASAPKSAKKKTSEKPENIKDAENAVLNGDIYQPLKNRIYAIREKLEKSLSDLQKIKGVSAKQEKYATEVRDYMQKFAIKYWNDKLVFLQNDVLSIEKKGRTDLVDKASERIKAFEDDLPYYLSVNKLLFRETSARDFLDLPHDYSWYMNDNPAFRDEFVKRNLLHEIPDQEAKKKTEEKGTVLTSEQIDAEIKKLSAELSEYTNRNDFTIDGYNGIKDKIDALEKQKLSLVQKPTMKMVDNLVDKIKAAFPSSLPDIKGVSEKQIKYADDLRKRFIDQMDTHWSKVLPRLRTRVENFYEHPNIDKATDLVDVIGKLERVADEVFPAINKEILGKTSAREIIYLMQKYANYTWALEEYISEKGINLKI